MKQQDPTTVNESLTCVQYLDGDINIKTSDNNTWLTHPREVRDLIEWLTNAARYMQEQWEEDVVVIHPEDIVFKSEEDEKAYYEWAERGKHDKTD